MKKIIKSKRGFTLIELICVISIITILLAVCAPSFTNFRTKAQQRAFQADIRALTTSALLFQSQFPNTPTIWSPFAGQVADPNIEITAQNLHDSWNLFVEGKYPQDKTRAIGSTFVVEIKADGSIDITPSEYGE